VVSLRLGQTPSTSQFSPLSPLQYITPRCPPHHPQDPAKDDWLNVPCLKPHFFRLEMVQQCANNGGILESPTASSGLHLHGVRRSSACCPQIPSAVSHLCSRKRRGRELAARPSVQCTLLSCGRVRVVGSSACRNLGFDRARQGVITGILPCGTLPETSSLRSDP
jgi:hypothetical protein